MYVHVLVNYRVYEWQSRDIGVKIVLAFLGQGNVFNDFLDTRLIFGGVEALKGNYTRKFRGS